MRHALLSALVLATLANPATAAIRCDGEFQINSQGEFQSLYCEEDNLAKVARARGISVTASQIRSSLSLEGDICRQISPDIRVSSICDQFINHSRRCRFNFPC